MRSISRLSASEVSGPVARMVTGLLFVERRDFFANHANQRLGGNGLGDAPRELDAIDGQRVACGNGGLIGNAQQSRAGAPHLLLQQPGRGVGRLALERVGADQLAEFGGLVRWGQARLAVDHGAHLVEVDLAARRAAVSAASGPASPPPMTRIFTGRPPGWQTVARIRGFPPLRRKKDAKDGARGFLAIHCSWLRCLTPANRCSASPLTRTLRHSSMNSAPMAR
jgi:hypothetical protein